MATLLSTSLSAVAAKGPELTRRGLLLGAGATAVTLAVPQSALVRQPPPFVVHTFSWVPFDDLVLIDEFQNLNRQEMYRLSRRRNVVFLGQNNMNFDLTLLNKNIDGKQWSAFERLDQASRRIVNGLARIVRRETYQAVSDLSKTTPPPITQIRQVIEKMESVPMIACEPQMRNDSNELLIIEGDQEKIEP